MRLAAIDIGSNAIHLAVADARDGALALVARHKEDVRLGAGAYAVGRLTDWAFRAGVGAVGRLLDRATDAGAEQVLAFATSATRDAANGRAFLSAVARETGVAPALLSGRTEAMLTFRAVRAAARLDERPVLVIDIGGGSAEIIVGDRWRVYFAESLPLGEQRLLDQLVRGGALARPLRDRLRRHVHEVAGRTLRAARGHRVCRVIGTSGTVRTLAEAAAGRPSPSLSRRALRRLTRRLCQSCAAERAALPGISERRAEAIPVGALVLDSLLELAAARRIEVLDTSVVEGVMLDVLDRRAGAEARKRPSRHASRAG